MSTTAVNFRLDSEVKQKFDSVCKDLGITATSAFSMFATKVAREYKIPFALEVDPFYSESNLEHLRMGIAQLDAGLGQEHELIDV